MSDNVNAPDTLLHKNRKVNLVGINGKEIILETIGTVFRHFFIYYMKLNPPFKLVNKRVKIHANGLLEIDVSKKYYVTNK